MVDEAVLALMTKLVGADPFSARIVSMLCAMTFTWWGNRNLTFQEHAAVGAVAMAREWLHFVVANSLGAAVNYASYALLVRFAPPPLNNAFLDVVIGVAAGLGFNYTLSKRFVFRARD